MKIVQKSLGVTIGVYVPPKATFGRFLLIGTIRVGWRAPLGRVPPLGQLERSSMLSSRELMISSGVAPSGIAKAVAREKRAETTARVFMMRNIVERWTGTSDFQNSNENFEV